MSAFGSDSQGEADPGAQAFFKRQARDEAFDLQLYSSLSSQPENPNREFFEALAAQEKRHLEFWARLAGADPAKLRAGRFRLSAALLGSRLLGPIFTVRRFEVNERKTIAKYEQILASGKLTRAASEELKQIIDDERRHEREIEAKFSDERVAYLGAAVLGLNDALVELTGALTGLVSSISNTRLIGFTGLVIGLAAALSMAASNFLSEGMSSGNGLRPAKAAVYTGTAYIIVVIALIFPFFLFTHRAQALGASWMIALLVIAGFSYYSSVLQETSFAGRFFQMLALGLGVAVITFTVGRVASSLLGVSV